ncbi:cellulose synthase E1-like protein [Medicago truncatula]|uniref:Cellulose synthase E1-like protein n=1 Tax=Medicago truncatula TaxID=3880 RepID=G7IV18_MEDTR|nr:cellulose synthase E1-like protein [Medicago truncatula]
MDRGRGVYSPLFETKKGRGRLIYRLFSISLFTAISFIWLYRFNHIITTNYTQQEEDGGKLVWFGMLAAELWFGFYWFLTQAFRWNLVFRQPFKDRLSQRYEHMLPEVDIFVCTADPEIEPPMMVINTVLSVMAFDYPSEKLSVYLSDDGGSEITFYALLEAATFAKHWLPFCKRFKVEPRSPAAYFNGIKDTNIANELVAIKKLYNEMEKRIEDATKLKRVPQEARLKHKGFSQWDSYSSKRDHDTILQILLHKKDHDNSKDVHGFMLPTLVYLAREKRPQYHHNYKAGAMNSLLRVSSIISNGKVILNVDCDMYSNNSESIRDSLCYFMDEEKGHEIAFVQSPQAFENVTKNDLYASALLAIAEVEFHGADGCGGPLYIGTGCFHKRESLCGMKFSDEYRHNWKSEDNLSTEETLHELEEKSKGLASCSYEENTQWGKEMGLKYGCPVEDVITGLSIQSNGWKSVYYNPARKAFLGVAPTSLLQVLIQHKRWSEGDFQILFSKYSPAWYAFGKINLSLQMGYCAYCLWAPNCLATLFYSIIPSLYLLKGIPLFPKILSLQSRLRFQKKKLSSATRKKLWSLEHPHPCSLY